MDDESAINRRIVGVAHAFGSLVRSRREAMEIVSLANHLLRIVDSRVAAGCP